MQRGLAAKLVELKQALRTRSTPLSTAFAPTGVIDDLLGGGFPRGRIAEVAGTRSSGKGALVLSAVARATTATRLVAWIDGPREIYPPATAAFGVDLARLLVVRPGCKTPPQPPDGRARMGLATMAARAAEIVAQSRAFALIVIDLGRARLEGTAAARLRQAAHESEAALVVIACGGGSSIAALRLEVTPRQVVLVRGGAAPPGTRVALPWLPTFRAPEQRAALLALAPGRMILRRRRGASQP